MAKKKKKKQKTEAGATAAIAGLAGGVVADVLTRVIKDSAEDYLNKNGKKKVKRLLKRVTSGTSRRSSSKRSPSAAR